MLLGLTSLGAPLGVEPQRPGPRLRANGLDFQSKQSKRSVAHYSGGSSAEIRVRSCTRHLAKLLHSASSSKRLRRRPLRGEGRDVQQRSNAFLQYRTRRMAPMAV